MLQRTCPLKVCACWFDPHCGGDCDAGSAYTATLTACSAGGKVQSTQISINWCIQLIVKHLHPNLFCMQVRAHSQSLRLCSCVCGLATSPASHPEACLGRACRTRLEDVTTCLSLCACSKGVAHRAKQETVRPPEQGMATCLLPGRGQALQAYHPGTAVSDLAGAEAGRGRG